MITTVQRLAPLTGTDALVIVDAREPAHYQDGHVPGAINLHPSHLEETVTLSSGVDVPNVMVSEEAAAEILGRHGISSSRPVCIYDEGGGYTAARLWWILDYLGHDQISILDGGMHCWERETAALEFSPRSLSSAAFHARVHPERLVRFSELITIVGSQEAVLVNALPVEAYLNETLPLSINCPYTATYAEDNYPLLRSRHELASLLARFGIGPMRRAVCFCGIGYTASQLYFSARLAGHERVALYDGSMVDWSARGGELIPGSYS